MERKRQATSASRRPVRVNVTLDGPMIGWLDAERKKVDATRSGYLRMLLAAARNAGKTENQ